MACFPAWRAEAKRPILIDRSVVYGRRDKRTAAIDSAFDQILLLALLPADVTEPAEFGPDRAKIRNRKLFEGHFAHPEVPRGRYETF
jgi:hypothetical protein